MNVLNSTSITYTPIACVHEDQSCNSANASKHYTLVEAQHELEEGIDVTTHMKECIASRMEHILNRQTAEGVRIISDGNALVFEIPEYPKLVFKLGGILKRFDALVRAKHTCTIHLLDSLIVPHAQKFEVVFEDYPHLILAEERFDIDTNEFSQENLYNTHSDKLEPLIRQLAVFIAQTKFSDVNWRNIPLINSSLPHNLQIALFDVDETDSAWRGFFGYSGYSGAKRLGLIGCTFTETQVDVVLTEAVNQKIKDCYGYKITQSDSQKIKSKRLTEIAEGLALKQFHTRRGIVTGRERLEVDWGQLNLNLDETKVTYINDGKDEITLTIREAVEKIIRYINESIQKSSEPTLKGMRQVNIITGPSMRNFERKVPVYISPFSCREDENSWVKQAQQMNMWDTGKNDLWVDRVVQALVESKYVFKVIAEHGCGILIQT